MSLFVVFMQWHISIILTWSLFILQYTQERAHLGYFPPSQVHHIQYIVKARCFTLCLLVVNVGSS